MSFISDLGSERLSTVPGDLIGVESASKTHFPRMQAPEEPFQNIWYNHVHLTRGEFEAS